VTALSYQVDDGPMILATLEVIYREFSQFAPPQATTQREPQPLGRYTQQPSTWPGRSEQILLKQVGCKARKTSRWSGVFS
jgi:hypothetical protein